MVRLVRVRPRVGGLVSEWVSESRKSHTRRLARYYPLLLTTTHYYSLLLTTTYYLPAQGLEHLDLASRECIGAGTVPVTLLAEHGEGTHLVRTGEYSREKQVRSK